MDGIPGEFSTPDGGWLMRAHALTLVRVAFNFGQGEAEGDSCSITPAAIRLLNGGISADLPLRRASGLPAAATPRRQRRNSRLCRKGSARASQILKKTSTPPSRPDSRRQVRKGLGWAENNSASYGSRPVFLASPSALIGINGKSGNTAKRDGDGFRWWIEIHLSVIQFAAAPLIVAVRAKDGNVDAGIKKLQEFGRLPPSVPAAVGSPPTNPTSRSAAGPTAREDRTMARE